MAHSRTALVLCGTLLFTPQGLRLHAQENSSQQTYEVRGTVINSVTHQPIARVLVTLAGEASSSQLTDNEGRFDFPNVPAGSCVLEARRPGYFKTGDGRDPSVAVGSDAPDNVLTLEPAGVITGQITLPASDAGSNIRVQLMRRAIQEGRARWQPDGMKVANSEGTFRFGNLQPGEYKLRTMTSIDPDIPSSQALVRSGFPSVAYPQEGDSASTGFLKISPGQQANAEIALTRQPFYSVTIPVASPLAMGFSVEITDVQDRMNRESANYDARQQQFRAWLPSGSYTATIQAFSGQEMGFASEPISVRSAPVQTQKVAVLPLHPIPVTIHKEFTATNDTGAPQIVQIENGKQIEISRDVNLMFYSTTSWETAGAALRHEPGGDESSWVLDNVIPGKYWVQAYASPGYVASITAGETDLAREPLVIGPGGGSAPIDIVLRNDMATLSVRLSNALKPHPDAQTPLGFLYLIPQFDSPSEMRQSVPSQQVTVVPNLQPGTYHVFALDHPVELEYHNPKALEPYAGKGKIVTLEPNGAASIDLDVISADTATQ